MILIKVKSSQGCLGKNLGCELAPDKIIEQLKEIYLTEDFKEINFRVSEVDIDKTNIEKTNENIRNKAKEVLDKFPVFIGGDHSVSYPIFQAFSELKNPGIIVFDAHPDCENDFNPPSHEDWLRMLIKNNHLKKENVILVGIRNMHKNEIEFLRENKINFFTMKHIFEEGVKEICDSVMEFARRFDNLYLSLDIDVADPAFAPGTGYLENGGLTARELIYFIQRLKLLKNLKAVDIVEVNPQKDFNNITSRLAAKLITEL